MIKKNLFLLITLFNFSALSFAQINTDRVMIIGRNALYYEDYVLSIQYFNQVIKAKPYLAEPYFYRAVAKFYLDDIKGAEEDCTSSLERNPFYTTAYQLRGDARLNLEDYDGAIQDYRKTLEYSPDNKFALINIAVANIHKKNYDEAEKELNELTRIYSDYTQGFLVSGSMYAEKGDTIKALDNYNRAIETDKYFYPSYSMRGLLYYGQKKYDEALNDLDKAISLDPIPVGNYINRGLVKYAKNDFRGAMEDYDNVIDKEPGNIIARFNRGLLRSRVGDDNRAIEDFDQVILHEPGNYIAYLNRALLKESILDYNGALADLNIVLEEYPGFYQGFYMRSEIKRKRNDLKGAERDYLYARNEEERMRREALSSKSDKESEEKQAPKTREKSDNTIDKFNLLVVADAEEQQKSKYKNETRGKVQDKQVKVELEPKFILTYYEKPDNNNLKGFVNYSPVVEALNRKNILNKKLILTNNEVALTEEQIQEHFASINEYSRLIDEQPDNAYLYFARALDYMLVQNYTSAIEDLNAAIKIDPEFVAAYFNLAVVYTRQLEPKEYIPGYEAVNSGKQNGALNLNNKQSSGTSTQFPNEIKIDKKLYEYDLIFYNYNKVIELAPDFVYAYYNRAEIRSMQRDYRAAILDYNQVIKKEPAFPDAYFNRGLNRLQLGEKERGLSDLRKAGELGILNAYSIVKRMSE